MSDLDKLIEAVEAGSDEFEMFCPLFHASGLCVEADGAYAGSLDAAKALHEALLPEQEYKIGLDVAQVYPAGKISSSIWGYTIENPNPARAWLIAILKAYRARDKMMGDEITCTNCNEYAGSPIADRIAALEAENRKTRRDILRDHTLSEVLSAATVSELEAEIRRRDNPPKTDVKHRQLMEDKTMDDDLVKYLPSTRLREKAALIEELNNHCCELEADLEKAVLALEEVHDFVRDLAPYTAQGHAVVPALQKACETLNELKGHGR